MRLTSENSSYSEASTAPNEQAGFGQKLAIEAELLFGGVRRGTGAELRRMAEQPLTNALKIGSNAVGF